MSTTRQLFAVGETVIIMTNDYPDHIGVEACVLKTMTAHKGGRDRRYYKLDYDFPGTGIPNPIVEQDSLRKKYDPSTRDYYSLVDWLKSPLKED